MKHLQFGYHLTIDMYGCRLEDLNNFDFCHEVLISLVSILEMKMLIPPYLIKAESNEVEGGKDPGGITGFTVIAESHISIHTFSKRGFASMDVYSCKSFDLDKAVNFLKERFKTQDVEHHFIKRGTRYPAENIYS